MSTPSESGDTTPYAPPYGSAPAYSDGGHGAGYSDTPYASPSAAAPEHGGHDTGTHDTAVLSPPAPPAAPARRRGVRTPAALLLACLLSGGVGGVVAHSLDDPTSATTSSSPSSSSSITQTTSTPIVSTPGSAQAAAAVISPSVVTIAVTGQQSVDGNSGQSSSQAVSDTGSGIILQADGYIVTNNHVVSAASSGGTVSVTFADGSTVAAKIVGTDASSDLAVIKVDKQGLKAAVFADSTKLAVGQGVLAVGAPLGLSNTVTEGIVSTLNRPVRTGETGATEQSVIDAIQTDAAINPGNSGGALVDLDGHVIGVNSAIATTGGSSTSGAQSGNIGVGFAIPANSVAKVAQQLITSGKATHSQIGISAGDADSSADGTPGRGALVQSVSAGSAAASAGLQQGDIVTKVDDRLITDADSLIVAIRSHDPGTSVTVTYLRDGASHTASATLTEAPAR